MRYMEGIVIKKEHFHVRLVLIVESMLISQAPRHQYRCPPSAGEVDVIPPAVVLKPSLSSLSSLSLLNCDRASSPVEPYSNQ